MMKALKYLGPGKKAWTSVAKPKILHPTDAIIKITATTICGTDLHILKGDTPEVTEGTILGHEGIGIVEEVGSDVTKFKKGDKTLISCITSCGTCNYCARGIQAHCLDGGWILGHNIDGTQAEFVRIPHADHSLYNVPTKVPDESLLMLSDILPTAFEVGVLSGKIQEGDVVAVVGCGPVGLSAICTASAFKPSQIIAIDTDEGRLEVAKKFGATLTVNPKKVKPIDFVNDLTKDNGKKPGVDVAIECVGVPATFDTCQEIIAPGGRIANVGVHGTKVDLQLQDLWIKNIQITTGLVSAYSTSDLLNRIESGSIDASPFVTHHFKLDEIEKAYEVFGNAADTNAIKVFMKAE